MTRLLKYPILTAALMLASGCSDISFKGAPEEFESNTYKMQVILAVGKPNGTATKSNGFVDNVGDLSGHSIGIYAFDRYEKTPFDTTASASCLINGKKAKVVKDDYTIWEGEPVYYPGGNDFLKAFDFFAYYTDDASVSKINVNDDAVVLDLDIDGNQDVMGAKAIPDFAPQEMLGSLFSYYSAQRNIVPIFNFKHYLVGLEFELVSNPETTRRKIYVDSLTLCSNTALRFTVASRDTAKLGIEVNNARQPGQVQIPLKERDGSPLKLNTYYVVNGNHIPDTVLMENVRMLIPEPKTFSSQIRIYFKYYSYDENYNDAGGPSTYDVLTTLQYPNGLKAGNRYKVTLKINGTLDIQTTVTQIGWEDSGAGITFGEEEKKPGI